jgi:hypothetical protein
VEDADRFKLLFGPYQKPRFRYGKVVFCEARGEVTICGLTDAPIPLARGPALAEAGQRAGPGIAPRGSGQGRFLFDVSLVLTLCIPMLSYNRKAVGRAT